MSPDPVATGLIARGSCSRRRSRWLRRPETSAAVAIVTLLAAWMVLVAAG